MSHRVRILWSNRTVFQSGRWDAFALQPEVVDWLAGHPHSIEMFREDRFIIRLDISGGRTEVPCGSMVVGKDFIFSSGDDALLFKLSYGGL